MSRAFVSNSNSTDIANTFNCTPFDDKSQILAWLSPLEPWVRHRDIGAQRVDSIGAWLLETKEFRRWYDGSMEDGSYHPTLFCDGNLGVGKTYITSLVIDNLCDAAGEEDTAVICFYYDFAARNEQSAVNMLGCLLKQLVYGLEKIPDVVVQGFRKQKKGIGGRVLRVSEILKMFQVITPTKRTFICVDALDECMPEHRMVVLESLRQILQGSPNTRLFMTARPHVRSEVGWRLGGGATFLLIQPTEDSVARYLQDKLKNDTTPRLMSSTLEAEIMRSIPEINSETFLLPSLHIKAILRGTTIAGRRRALKSIKNGAGLGEAYGVALERIRAQDKDRTKLAMGTLTWVCHSERPLHVDELCNALAVEIGETDFDPENVPSIDTLLDCCQGLITIDKEASNVRLIHYTVQEYLCSHPALFDKPHSILAETCLTYLNSQQVKNLTSRPLSDHQGMPFLKYSSRYWGTHAGRELSDHAKTLALELLGQYEDHVSAVSLLEQVTHPSNIGNICISPLFSGLHCASFFGIAELVATIINEGSEIDQRDCTGSTPLAWAAKNGHVGVAKLLLGQENIDPNCSDVDDRTPLGCAAINGHEGVVKLLLGREDVDPNHPDIDDRTPLGSAAIYGHRGVVKLLFGREDIDPNRPDKYDRTPLGWAAVEGHEGVAKLLLERKDIDPNHPDANDRTPLGCAAIEGHEAVVKLLLEREDVDPNRPDKYNQTPLRCAAVDGHEGMVRLLLKREDIDPNHPDANDRTPLGCAALEGHDAVVKLLLEREDVDPNRPDKHNQTPLRCATVDGHEEMVRLLLKREDIDPNHPDANGRTPLVCAALKGHETVVKLLLERQDVDPNRPDKHNQTPLGCAAIDGHERIVRLLLKRKDTNPNHPDANDRTPLGCAALEGHEGVVRLLLEREDVDPNRPDKHNQTPLRCAAVDGHEGMVRLLLKRKDINPNRRDANNRTPLECAAFKRHQGVVKLLLERGDVDPGHLDRDHPDKDGITSLQQTARQGHERVLGLLVNDKRRPQSSRWG